VLPMTLVTRLSLSPNRFAPRRRAARVIDIADANRFRGGSGKRSLQPAPRNLDQYSRPVDGLLLKSWCHELPLQEMPTCATGAIDIGAELH